MGLKPRTPNEGQPDQAYVSTITAEDLAAYAEYADGYESDEEEAEEERPQRPNFASKLSSAVRNFSLPSPEEIKNSNFVKSFNQPLMVKSKVQRPTTQQSNAVLLMEKTPAELSKISKLSDFPLPNLHFKKNEGKECNGVEEEQSEAGEKDTFGIKALREQKLITSITESEVDDETLIRNMEITKNMTPAQLSEIRSIKDFPIPESIKHILDRPVKQMAVNGHAPEPVKEEDEKHESFFAGFMETKLITNIKENTDYDTLKKRQDLVNSKTPKELSSISGMGDLPIPSKIEKMIKGDKKEAFSSEDFETKSSLMEGGFSIPKSFKMELAVGATVEDEDVVREHRELVKTKSVSELSKITSFSDIPIPEAVENILKKKESDNDNSTIKSSSLSISDITSGRIIPESLRETKLITNIKVEKDLEKLLARQTLIKNQTPMELGSVKNLHDFPIPSRLQNLHFPTFSSNLAKSNGQLNSDFPTPPPRNKSCNASIYESLPSSLRNEVIVRSRTITDEESKLRQELIRSKSPVELSQISSLKDFPVPKTIEKLFEKNDEEQPEIQDDRTFVEKYSTLPSSLKTNLLVGAKIEDQEVVYERSETIKSKSVSELSEIRTMSDIPIPSTLTRLARRDYAPVERKKLFKQQMKSQSTQSLSLQGTLPRSLRTQQLLVKAKIESPETLQSRRSIVESKSVAELSKVSSFSDIPVPGFLSKFASRSLSRLHSLSMGQLDEPKENNQAKGIYATLPKSLNCELLVSKSVQDVSILEQRMQLINEKSTKELARIGSMKEFPVPDVVKSIYYKSMERLHGTGNEETDMTGGKSMNSLLPSMLSQPLIVTTKIEDPQILLERQQIQQQKSIHELSKIRNLNEFPLPCAYTLPNVPLPRVKNILQLVARTPKKTPSPSLSQRVEPESPLESEKYFDTSDLSQVDEDEYSHLEEEATYEVISKEKPRESPPVEIETFGLATQIKGTPERNTRSKKKKPEPRNRRSQMEQEEREEVTTEASEAFETPPPLPPKRSPQKSLSVDSQQSGETEETESSPAPVKGVLTLEAMNGNIQVIKNEASNGLQSRPLPPPPAPARYGRGKESDRTLAEESQKFQSCRETLTEQTSRTLLVSEDDDNTMADSIVESLVSCTDTIICDDDDTYDDDPYPSVNFESGMSELLEPDPPMSSGKRLEEGTQQLSMELMNHVESLRSTLDNMSSRLGARSRSRSNSRPRSSSRPRSTSRPGSRPHSLHHQEHI